MNNPSIIFSTINIYKSYKAIALTLVKVGILQ